ncbi:MAG: hypothetical protein GWP91_02615 [Rhodobacterales bacterium]|nr:hypothetical protein [Rhodobacterales bacterium]
MRSSLFALALLGATQAQAIAPQEGVYQGVEPQRVWTTHAHVQAAMAHGAAFQDFTRDDFQGWQARFDEVTGTPLRTWGAGIPVPTDSEANLVEAITDLLAPHHDLFQFENGNLVPRSARYVPRVDTWYVDFDTPRDGINIYRGGLTVRVKHGHLMSIGASAYGNTRTEGDFIRSQDEAIAIARTLGPAPDAAHTTTDIHPIWLPVHDLDGLRLVATWKVESRTYAPPGKWVSFVQAQTGELLSVHNEVRFAQGTVTGSHQLRTLDGSPPVISPMPYAPVFNGVDLTFTDFDGQYTMADGAEYSATLDGDYAQVQNDAGAEGELFSPDSNLAWTTDDATQGEISSYIYLHHVKIWGERVAPEVGIVSGTIQSNVNLDSGTCNAYFDGQVNFFEAGDGCNNTAQIADVNYHEWGHGFHLSSVESSWYGFDGSLSEGAADVVSFYQTDDNIMAPYFFQSGSGIRDIDNNNRYPEDFSVSEYAVHSNGLIFGGAMYDLTHMLRDQYGFQVGNEVSEQIFAGLLKGGPDVSQSYDEAIVADDDDGNLANGTPNECAIIDAFGAHGLGPPGSGTQYLAAHQPLSFQSPATDHVLQVELSSAAPNCFEVTPDDATVYFRVDGSGWNSVALNIVGLDVQGAIPAQDAGTFVEYYIQVNDASGPGFTAPTGGEVNPFTFYVGGVLEVSCDDFDKGRGGFKHELVSGEEAEGADDWQWGSPAGNGGDPSAAYSGDKVWGNDLGWDEFNGQYQNDKKNRLKSPVIDTKHYLGSFLHYQRWLTVEDGLFDQARISADDDVVWRNIATGENDGGKHHIEDQWTPHAVGLDGAGDDGSVQLSWTITSDGGLTFGGWTLDDVCIYAPDTPDNRLGISDLVAVRDGAVIRLSWTNPLHAPLSGVTLVRNAQHMPASPADGTLVFSSTRAEVGDILDFIDVGAPASDVYYALYATDGENVLSWTREGFNAAFVVGNGPASSNGDGNGGAGCGCNAGSTPGGWTWLAALSLLLVRRRRG